MLIDPDILDQAREQADTGFSWHRPFRRKKTKNNRSLLNKIILWMFGPLFLLWTIGLVITYFIAQNIANAPYDRALTDHLRMVRHEIEQQNILKGAQLSPFVINLLHGDPEHLIYWDVRDANGNSLDGNHAIPLPANWSYDMDKVRVNNESMDGHSVRVAYVWGGVDSTGLPFLTVVAQSNQMRARLQQEILTGMLTPQLIVLPLAALLAGLGLTQGLEPLTILQERIRARRANDTSPITAELAPAEIVPLIAAMNSLLQRLTAAHETQRRFVSNAAHQLKTPLAGMRTQAELALRERSPEKMDASLQQLIRGSDRATRLVNQMLALARAENPDNLSGLGLEQIDLNPLAEQQSAQWVDTAINKHIDLGFECAPFPVHIHGDPLMLAEMLNNLIENAIIYSASGGKVTIRTGGDALSAYLEVEDTGPGIPVEERERVFDRFYRVLGTNVDGSGLGLPIVKEIAEYHEATVEFMPTSGDYETHARGTRIRVSFSRIKNLPSQTL
ncbi:sensor histidine kinase N-terminal domain-containing protein [Alcaligenaceae bacterium]|nr:sensor histidine kinase N-terminal domain-containing protein [Alcaligenaceae bacterium]